MTSLLQFDGEISRKGVRLEFYLVDKKPWVKIGDKQLFRDDDRELVHCHICGKSHPRLYLAWRKPVGTLGQFVVFRYNGEEHVPDLSIPISVEKLPRGAVRLDDIKNAQYWHRS